MNPNLTLKLLFHTFKLHENKNNIETPVIISRLGISQIGK